MDKDELKERIRVPFLGFSAVLMSIVAFFAALIWHYRCCPFPFRAGVAWVAMAYTSRKNNIFECGGQRLAFKYGEQRFAFECGEQHFAPKYGGQHPAYDARWGSTSLSSTESSTFLSGTAGSALSPPPHGAFSARRGSSMWLRFTLFDVRVVAHYLGVLVSFFTIALAVPLVVAVVMQEWEPASRYLLAVGISLIVGSGCVLCAYSRANSLTSRRLR